MQAVAENLAAILDDLAAELLHATGVANPPVDALLVARRLGLRVLADEAQAGRARFVRGAGQRGPSDRGSILVRQDPRKERLQWAVAHEIGEAHAEVAFARFAGAADGPDDLRERIANELAGRLLAPRPWLQADGPRSDWDLYRLKQRYRTASHELLARRMLDLELPIVMTVIDAGRVTWRRNNCGTAPARMSTEERDCWRAVHEQGGCREFACAFGRVRTWAIHEADWKREIVRVDVTDCDEPS